MSVDLDIFGPEETGDAQSITGLQCSGIRKLAQRCLLCLFKEEDNIADLGFFTDIHMLEGANADVELIKNRMLLSVDKIITYIKVNTDLTAPDDETLDTIKIDELNPDEEDPGVINIDLIILSQAGESLSVQIPSSSITTNPL